MKIEKLLVNTSSIERFTCIEDVYDNNEIIDLLKDLFESNMIRMITGDSNFDELKTKMDLYGINYYNNEIIFVRDDNCQGDIVYLSEEIAKFANDKNIIIHLTNNFYAKKIKFNLFKELSISFDNIKYKCYNYNTFNDLIKQIKNQETIELNMNNVEKL